MEFFDPESKTLERPFGNGLSVVQDEVKGRCFVATQRYCAGEVVFEEKALLFGSCDDDIDYTEKNSYQYLKKHNPKLTLSMVKKFIIALADTDEVESLDTARCFLHGICIADKSARDVGASVTNGEGEVLQMELMKLLQPSKLEANIQVVKHLRKQFKNVIPREIPDELAGKLLGVLRNNQMELDQYGGSALFPGASITEHNCFPNCSFSTSSNGDSEHSVLMTAIRNINAGDRLSIDYTNDFYHPRRVRQAHLRKVYGFECTCQNCLVPTLLLHAPQECIPLVEPFRVFTCPRSNCSGGRVCVVYVSGEAGEETEMCGFVKPPPPPSTSKKGVGSDDGDSAAEYEEMYDEEGDESDSEDLSEPITEDENLLVGLCCQSCGWRGSKEDVKLALALEDSLCDETPDSFEALSEWREMSKSLFTTNTTTSGDSGDTVSSLQQLTLHDEHYLLFWLEDDLAMGLAEDMQQEHPYPSDADGMTSKRSSLLKCCHTMKALVSRLESNSAVPEFHSEKTIYWDRLAQLYIAAADCCVQESDKQETLNEAKLAFEQAYAMSVKCAGLGAANTLQLKEMVDNMPTTADELASRYSRAL